MEKIISTIKKSFIVNLSLVIIKIIFGFVGHSRALLIDGIHSFSDLVTDVVVMVGSFFANKPADKEHPFGHGQAEYLLSLFVGIVVLTLGFNIILEVEQTSVTIPSLIVVYVSAFTIIVKLILAKYLLLKGKKYKSSILTSSGKESRADVITSVLVLISSILMQFDYSYLRMADTVVSVIIGLFIMKTGYEILKENVNYIIGSQVTDKVYRKKINKWIMEQKEVKGINDLIILNFGHYYKIIVDVMLDPNSSLLESHKIADEIEILLREKDKMIEYVTVHMSPFIK